MSQVFLFMTGLSMPRTYQVCSITEACMVVVVGGITGVQAIHSCVCIVSWLPVVYCSTRPHGNPNVEASPLCVRESRWLVPREINYLKADWTSERLTLVARPGIVHGLYFPSFKDCAFASNNAATTACSDRHGLLKFCEHADGCFISVAEAKGIVCSLDLHLVSF